VAAFVPGNGFRDALTSETLFQGFLNARFIYYSIQEKDFAKHEA
jgi:hypothetical protein